MKKILTSAAFATMAAMSGSAFASDSASINYGLNVGDYCSVSAAGPTNVTVDALDTDGTAKQVNAPNVTMNVTCNNSGAVVSISSVNAGLTNGTDTIAYTADANVEVDNSTTLLASYASATDDSTDSAPSTDLISNATLTLGMETVDGTDVLTSGEYTDTITVAVSLP